MYKLFLTTISILLGQAHATPPITVTSRPTKPIVFTAPFTYQANDGHEVSVAPPWVQMQLDLHNSLTYSVKILRVRMQAVAPNREVSEQDFTPEQDNYSVDCGPGTKFYAKFDSFGVFAPGSDGLLQLSTNFPTNCHNADNSFSKVFVFGGLPYGSNPPNSITSPGTISNYVYQIYVWIYGVNTQTGEEVRLENSFETQ